MRIHLSTMNLPTPFTHEQSLGSQSYRFSLTDCELPAQGMSVNGGLAKSLPARSGAEKGWTGKQRATE